MMRSLLFLCGLVALLAAAPPGDGAPVKGNFVKRARVDGHGSRSLVVAFKGGEKACVVLSGDGSGYLGLYVFDADGNCVARDDRGDYPTRDDAAVEWFPTRTGRYTI